MFANYIPFNWKTHAVLTFDAELLLLEFLLTKESVFFDIGSNKGEYGYYAEKWIDPKCIFLFEPEKKLNKQLQAIFSNCHIYNIALSDIQGTHQFKIPIINGIEDNCLSSLEVENKEEQETDAVIYNVTTDTLDNFTNKHSVFPDLIKIDVEGHELSVLKGAKEYIANQKPTLIIEIEQRHHKTQNVEIIFESFIEQGYECYYYSKKQGKLFSYREKTHLTNTINYFGKIDYINNYIFIHSTNTSIKPIELINKEIALRREK